MRRGREFIGIEVKATANPGSSEYTGLRAIAQLSGVKRRLLVHLGTPLTPAITCASRC